MAKTVKRLKPKHADSVWTDRDQNIIYFDEDEGWWVTIWAGTNGAMWQTSVPRWFDPACADRTPFRRIYRNPNRMSEIELLLVKQLYREWKKENRWRKEHQ